MQHWDILVTRVFAVGIIVETRRSVHDRITPGTTDRECVTHYSPLRFSIKRHHLQRTINVCYPIACWENDNLTHAYINLNEFIKNVILYYLKVQ